MGFFAAQWIVLIAGFLIHVGLDRSAARRSRARVYELAALWLLVGMGAFNILSGLGHIGPYSEQSAASIGFTPSMFQWEVGWADIAVGVLGVGCAWRTNRGGWTNATLVALTILFFGDGIGHIMQLVVHGNTAPNNVWALPTNFLVPALSILFVFLWDGTPTRAQSGGPPRRMQAARRRTPLLLAPLPGNPERGPLPVRPLAHRAPDAEATSGPGGRAFWGRGGWGGGRAAHHRRSMTGGAVAVALAERGWAATTRA